jgi:murein L,D-transpeptidase YcbB/YkuD
MALSGRWLLLFCVCALLTGGGAFAEDTEVQSTPNVQPAAVSDTNQQELPLDKTQAAINKLLTDPDRASDVLDKANAATVIAFYSKRNYAPAWIAEGDMADSSRALISRIASADTDGLDPSAFNLPSPDLGPSSEVQPLVAARADILLSQAVATYVRQAYSGRLDPSKISSNIDYEKHSPDLVSALAWISVAPNPAEALAAYNPPHPEFVALREKLSELRSAKPAKRPIKVPAGKSLKLGVEDARVGFLRQRLGLPSDVAFPARYDESVVEAVSTFQRSSGLKADGVVGPKTLAALNAEPVDPVPAILVNMEKWRWMPRDLGRFYVRVNIPDFTVDVYKNGTPIHTTRIVVGKPTQQTPIFSDEIEHAVVNPAWNVPASITQNEMLPAARRNPRALSGYQVFALIKGRYRAVNPRRINWRRIDARRIQIRQPPGSRNALGKVKFMFPNKHSVYLHDTPAKSLFKRDYRAYSHGCMRVMNPMEFAEALLTEEPKLDSAYLKSLYGSRERRVNLTQKVPVHITYFTAWVDESGTLQQRDDLYGHDERIATRLGAL